VWLNSGLFGSKVTYRGADRWLRTVRHLSYESEILLPMSMVEDYTHRLNGNVVFCVR